GSFAAGALAAATFAAAGALAAGVLAAGALVVDFADAALDGAGSAGLAAFTGSASTGLVAFARAALAGGVALTGVGSTEGSVLAAFLVVLATAAFVVFSCVALAALRGTDFAGRARSSSGR